MKDLTKHDGPMALSYIAIATGALAIGAIAVGAIAIGSMAIGRLAIQRVQAPHCRDRQSDRPPPARSRSHRDPDGRCGGRSSAIRCDLGSA